MGRIANLVDIAGADALLHVGQSGASRMLAAQQVRNQRVHARGGEQHGRVILRNDGGAGDHGVALALEEVQPHGAQFAGGHLFHVLSPFRSPRCTWRAAFWHIKSVCRPGTNRRIRGTTPVDALRRPLLPITQANARLLAGGYAEGCLFPIAPGLHSPRLALALAVNGLFPPHRFSYRGILYRLSSRLSIRKNRLRPLPLSQSLIQPGFPVLVARFSLPFWLTKNGSGAVSRTVPGKRGAVLTACAAGHHRSVSKMVIVLPSAAVFFLSDSTALAMIAW